VYTKIKPFILKGKQGGGGGDFKQKTDQFLYGNQAGRGGQEGGYNLQINQTYPPLKSTVNKKCTVL
jgi:hypothetical protein